ncbi:F-box protein At3g07870-like [Lathyrus oleraceus]|uniref:F-box protein At3g07870-like n=1 Tax=Pisum sativum TaxID=3888 RepID=UPI0021D0AFA0|nr:F-box protein At3g07870-like [Pisum sativum]
MDPKRSKLGPRGIKCAFIGYAPNSKAYRLLNLENNVIIESRDVESFENVITKDKESESPANKESWEEYSSWSIEIQPETASRIIEIQPEPRISKRNIPIILQVEDDPKTYKEAVASINSSFWKDAIQDKMDSIMSNHTWHSTSSGIHEDKTTVKVLTLGTHCWRTIPKFPFDAINIDGAGKCVSHTVNWLAYTETYRVGRQPFIVSLDLAKESFQKIFLPDHERRDGCNITLLVWKDCLGLISDHDVWVMKTYGVQESWIKLFSVSYLEDPEMSSILTKALYIFEDDKLLLELQEEKRRRKLIVYNPKNGSFKVTKFVRLPEVCVESLLSPDII